jgi:hypothetical protein
MPVRGEEEGERLSLALDTYARRQAEETPDAPAFMMLKTEVADGEIVKSLVFEARSHAAAFLSFWRQERRRAS